MLTSLLLASAVVTGFGGKARAAQACAPAPVASCYSSTVYSTTVYATPVYTASSCYSSKPVKAKRFGRRKASSCYSSQVPVTSCYSSQPVYNACQPAPATYAPATQIPLSSSNVVLPSAQSPEVPGKSLPHAEMPAGRPINVDGPEPVSAPVPQKPILGNHTDSAAPAPAPAPIEAPLPKPLPDGVPVPVPTQDVPPIPGDAPR